LNLVITAGGGDANAHLKSFKRIWPRHLPAADEWMWMADSGIPHVLNHPPAGAVSACLTSFKNAFAILRMPIAKRQRVNTLRQAFLVDQPASRWACCDGAFRSAAAAN
jgi:hypothetical protein